MSVQKQNQNNFNNAIANGTALVDFYADWCGPCVMKRIIIAISVALMFIPLLIGCHGNNKNSYEQITPAEAKALMDSEEGYIILDVRTPEEFAERHIEGAILIPDYEIREKAESILTDKDQLILVYCRSGRRSKNAANELVALGYTNIKEFGGINDWKYGTVTE